jgi:chromosome segregation ATPase
MCIYYYGRVRSMSSLFEVNQLSAKPEVALSIEEPKTVLENRDREIYALRQQLQTLKTLYKQAKMQVEMPVQKSSVDLPSENEYSKQRIEKLMAALAEREKQMRVQQQEAKQQQVFAVDAWQKERQAKQTALEEIAALQGQLEFLKTKMTAGQSVISNQQQHIERLQEENKLATSQLQIASVELQEKDALHHAYEKLRLETVLLTERLDAALGTIEEQGHRLQGQESVYQFQLEKLAQLEMNLAEMEQQMHSAVLEKSVLQESVFKAQNGREDAEARLKVAHYHLAKKVKETTMLADHGRDLDGKVQELTMDLSSAQEKILELQSILEKQVFQEKNRQCSLQDSLKEAEASVEIWKKKYAEVYVHWQEHDQRLKEFERLQDKLLQMKSLCMNFDYPYSVQVKQMTTNGSARE